MKRHPRFFVRAKLQGGAVVSLSTRFVSTSAVRGFQDLKYTRAVDSRIAATEGDKRAIDYVAKNFRKSGLEVKYDDSGLDTCPKLSRLK